MKLNKNWTVYVIHHSHTDIGYTNRQEKIERYHADFIRDAIAILDDYNEGLHPEYEGFVWQCENYWQVKNFYASAMSASAAGKGAGIIEKFEHYVKSGSIGLSGNYLNLTELIDFPTLQSRLMEARAFADRLGIPLRTGMSADINGFAWGYADALYNAGITCFYSCLHPHHGIFPLRKKQIPFFWQGPGGNKILVWNGEHYHFGNELGFAPHANSQYMLDDEYSPLLRQGVLFKKNAKATEELEMEILEKRLFRYLKNFENEGYELSIIPAMVSGAITDNGPPGPLIAERVRRISERFEGQVTVKMATLEDFFKAVEKNAKNIPVYSGDWNDWWADGVGSTPAAVKIFREAQQKLSLYEKLRNVASTETASSAAALDETRENLILYAEHTWGYSSSVSEPWETLVDTLDLVKTGYAVNAFTRISRLLDERLAELGEVSIRHTRKPRWRIINPHDHKITLPARLYIEFWEYFEGVHFAKDTRFELYDEKTGKIFDAQLHHIARTLELEFLPTLEAHEELTVSLRILPADITGSVCSRAEVGAEGVRDIIISGEPRADAGRIETDHFVICLDQQKGIADIIDRHGGESILDASAPYPAFSGIYEITPIETSACEERRRMGRNRKSTATRRHESRLTRIAVTEKGPVFISCELDYELAGTRFYRVSLKIYRHAPLIEAMVRIHKQSEWAPENLYIALPFSAGSGETRYIEKTGCLIRPGIDQLPGTNQLFYLLQNGVIMSGKDKTLILAIKDTPLVTFGTLEARPIDLSKDENWELNWSPLFSWAMNNFWETNFKVDTGGFYEFSYSVSLHEQIKLPEAARKICAARNEGLAAFNI